MRKQFAIRQGLDRQKAKPRSGDLPRKSLESRRTVMRWQYSKAELRTQTRFSPGHDVTMSARRGIFTASEI